MPDPTPITLQKIFGDASRQVKEISRKKNPPPRVETGCDDLTLSILKAVGEKSEVDGAYIVGKVLTESGLHANPETIFMAACMMASPLMTRYPLLSSPQVSLPERPPSMWSAIFSITEIGSMVLHGQIPNCLINGYNGPEAKMPPIRAKNVGDALELILSKSEDHRDKIEMLLGEIDYPLPCLFDSGGGWSGAGKGSVTLSPNAEIMGSEVQINMIPVFMSQEVAIEKIETLLEDIPGFEGCEARKEDVPLPWYKVVAKCRHEQAARSCLEVVISSALLGIRQKISYAVAEGETGRSHSTPQEILRGFALALDERGGDPHQCRATLASIDSGGRCAVKVRRGKENLGPYVIWTLDSTCRNRVGLLAAVKKQGIGGKGSKLSESDMKFIVVGRVRQRAALFNFAGMAYLLDIRGADSSPKLSHPAETLPEGATGVCCGVTPSSGGFLVLATSQGLVKKMSVSESIGGRKGTKQIMKTGGGDSLVSACCGEEEDDIVLISRGGMATRFNLKQVRSMGPAARGVTGMKLKDGDRVAALVLIPNGGGKIAIFGSDGKGTLLDGGQVPLQNRGGGGVAAVSLGDGKKVIGAVRWIPGGDGFLGTRNGRLIRFSLSELGEKDLKQEGNTVIETDIEDAVTAVAVHAGSELTEEGAEGHGAESAPDPDDISGDGHEAGPEPEPEPEPEGEGTAGAENQ